MNQLLYEMGGWLGFLSRPAVLLQFLSSTALVLLYVLLVVPRLKKQRYRLMALGSVGLWLVLRLNGLLIERLGLPGGLVHFYSQVWGMWVLLALARLLLLTRFPAKQIQLLYSRLVQPLFGLVVLVALVNQLGDVGDVAEIPLFSLFGTPLTSGGLPCC